MDLELATTERAAALVNEIGETEAEKIALETQTCNDSSALNPDEVSRAKELVKERDRQNENEAKRYHADSKLIK